MARQISDSPPDDLAAYGRGSDAGTCALTFAQAADAVLEEARRAWTTAGTLAQWRRAMDVHAAPFRDKPVAQITIDDVVDALAPLWTAKPALAAKVRKLWERVLDHCSASPGASPARPNPAAWTPTLRAGLRGPKRPIRSTHVFADLPPMMTQLRSGRGLGRIALELSVLLGVGLEPICNLRTEDLSCSDEGWGVAFLLKDPGRAEGAIAAWRPLTGRAWSLVESLLSDRATTDPAAAVFRLPNGSSLSARGVAELSTRIFPSRAERLSHGAVLGAFRAWAHDQARKALPGPGGMFAQSTVEAAIGAGPGDGRAFGGGAEATAQAVRRLFEAWSVFLSPE